MNSGPKCKSQKTYIKEDLQELLMCKGIFNFESARKADKMSFWEIIASLIVMRVKWSRAQTKAGHWLQYLLVGRSDNYGIC